MSENIQDIYPLSPMQQGMLFHTLFAPETEVYNEQLGCGLVGKLDTKAFQRAWEEVVKRHDILRSAFLWEDLDEPLQVVHEEVDLPFSLLDWSDKSPEQQKKTIDKLFREDRQDGFDLNAAPLMRLTVIKLAEDNHYLIWTHHHLLFDGWGLPIILKEIFSFYESFSQNKQINIPTVRPYRDYIAWLQQQDMDKAKMHWQDKLANFTAPTPLTFLKQQNGEDSEYARERRFLSESLSEKLNAFTKNNQLTLNTIVQGAWALLLSKYSGEDDIVFGATVSGRPADLPGSEFMVGLFINTLPVRVFIDPDETVLDWLKQLQLQQAENRQFEYTPLVKIQGWSDVPRSMPLFDSLMVFENYPVDDSLTEQNSLLQLEDVRSFARTNYPVTLVAAPGKRLAIDLAFETRKLDVTIARLLMARLEKILESFAAGPQQRLARISLLSDEEFKHTISVWNKTEAAFPNQTTLHQWFEDQVDKTPDAVALVFQDQSLTFAELNQKANQLAHHLLKKGIKPEKISAILIDRSPEMVISLLAVLKAGGAYVPIDPDYPEERINYILEDAGVSLLITQSQLSGKVTVPSLPTVVLDRDRDKLISSARTDNPVTIATPSNLAYVIYTSGSTGQPKGVLLQHRGACNLISAMITDFNIDASSNVLQFASFGFDASVAEIFMGLLSGAKLHLADRETILSDKNFIDFINENKITTATLPPSFLALLPEKDIKTFDTIASVGDKCSWELANTWGKVCRFMNGYGPTEATVGSSWGLVNNFSKDTVTVPIGSPIRNAKIYIVDQNLNLVPPGIAGEICIGGAGIARGYLNRPGLTAERFIPDPFSGTEGGRLYRTGDLGRFLDDGTIEFVGRIDFQIKLRGFRIELGEIEAALKQIENIKDAVVLMREDTSGDKRLVAYLVADASMKSKIEDIREKLKEKLPEFMIPAAFIIMDAFPLTPSGKVNRKALPKPEQSDLDLAASITAPRTPEEELMAGIWSDILHTDKIGVHNSFFDLGGHSLMATQVISRIRDAFEVELPLRSLFEKPTIALLVDEINTIRNSEAGISMPPITKVPREGHLPLSFAQQRLWFLDQLEPGSASYNIPAAFRLKGKLNVEVLEKSINTVIDRHETLRTSFSSERGKPVQIIQDTLKLELPVTDLSDLSEAEQEQKVRATAEADARAPFDLSKAPLLRTELLKLSGEEHVMLFNMHHIISDGWSISIMVREVAVLYESLIKEEPAPLPELDIQYADFAHWQRNWLSGEVLEKQIDYWKNELAGIPPLLELPTDRPRPAVQTFNGAVKNITIPAELSAALRKLSQEQGVTLFMTLMAAFQSLLHRYSSQDDVVVGSPIANRTNSAIENLIGFFVNTLIFRAAFSAGLTYEDLLRQVREAALGAYAHQDLPFEKLVEELQPDRDMSHAPIFQVAFVLQNLPPQQSVDLPDLTMQALEADNATAKYDLTLTMTDHPDGLLASLEYNTDLFNAQTMQRMLDHFMVLLRQVSEEPDIAIDKIDLLKSEEKQLILRDWNQTEKPFPGDQCVHEWFESLVEKQPEAPAIIFKANTGDEEKVLSYQAYNQKVNQLARFLIDAGLKKEEVVGICMERSVEMALAMMAILKAGGAYVPIDPAYPQDRIEYMIEDSGLNIILTQEAIKERLPSDKATLIALDSQWSKIEKFKDSNPAIALDPENLAYLIYTSGSTGKPKGTMLRHRGACNLANAQIDAFKVKEGSRIMQFSSLSFDAATWEFIMATLSGSALILTSRETIAAGQELVKLMADQKVTTITIPPSVLAVLPQEPLPDLNTLITAGEAVSGELVDQWGKDRTFFNAYGPTETTVCASMHKCTGDYPGGPPIGRPINNFKLYILDRNMQPVPVGVPGELCMGGIGLARGYLNRPDLTAEKFIPDHYSGESGARMYRSGDLVRYLPDGEIEFLGRIDHQVKIRGFRIELGEIESVLDNHEIIKDVVVLAREDRPGDKRLAAYVVPKDGNTIDTTNLRDYLRERMPEYMVPSAIMSLDELPLTPNGKIDRKALPVPELSRDELSSEFVAPRNEDEEKLTAIVGELLNIKKVGVHDNFFELGGHSLLATQFMSRLRETFGVELPLRTLFERPTVAEIAEAVERAEKEEQKAEAMPQIKRVSRSQRTRRRSDLGD